MGWGSRPWARTLPKRAAHGLSGIRQALASQRPGPGAVKQACGAPSKSEMKLVSAALSAGGSSGLPVSCFMLLSSLSVRRDIDWEGVGGCAG